jgi:hypothetical protein
VSRLSTICPGRMLISVNTLSEEFVGGPTVLGGLAAYAKVEYLPFGVFRGGVFRGYATPNRSAARVWEFRSLFRNIWRIDGARAGVDARDGTMAISWRSSRSCSDFSLAP